MLSVQIGNELIEVGLIAFIGIIASTSALSVLFFLALFLVGGVVEQIGESGFVADFDFYEPAGLIRILDKSFQIIDQIGVDGDNFAVHGAIQIAYGLDRLDFAEGLACADLAADFGQRHEDQVGEDFEGKGGDSDGGSFPAGGAGLDVGPFMRFGIQQLLRIHFLFPFLLRL